MTTSIKRRRRSFAGLALLTLVTLALLLGASRLSRRWFERPAGRPETSPAPVATRAAGPTGEGAGDTSLFRVVGSDGEVEAFRDGRWNPIQRGDLLTPQDVLRTAPGARAVLRVGASSEIELREKVEIKLERLSGTGAIIDLRRGKVEARVARAGDNITIGASETRTSNDGPARYVVMADETSGRVSVAAIEGIARFASGGKEVIVTQGTESRSERGGVPADPEKISQDVLMAVVWPEGERHEAKATIAGRVRPSSAVNVNGASLAVAPDGRFTISVPMREGPNQFRIEAEDIVGRKRSDAATLVRSVAQQPELTPVRSKLWTK